MPLFDWDRGLDFAETRTRLVGLLDHERPMCSDDLNPKKRLTHYSILLIQLVNGARISEAFDANRGWGENGDREQEVRVRKRRKDVELRLVMIPPELQDGDRPYLLEALDRGLTIGATKTFAIDALGFNTHSLRYAQITELARKGMAPQLIAKVTHHKTLNFILSYTQQKEANKALRELVG
jgi:integrase